MSGGKIKVPVPMFNVRLFSVLSSNAFHSATSSSSIVESASSASTTVRSKRVQPQRLTRAHHMVDDSVDRENQDPDLKQADTEVIMDNKPVDLVDDASIVPDISNYGEAVIPEVDLTKSGPPSPSLDSTCRGICFMNCFILYLFTV